jgi:hypothetical protein
MDGVSAEIVKEVAVFLDHPDGDSGAGEQQPGHHPARAAADDKDVGFGHGSSCRCRLVMPGSSDNRIPSPKRDRDAGGPRLKGGVTI